MRDPVRPAAPYDAAALHRVAALTFPLACTPQTPDEEVAAFVAAHLSESAFAAHLADPARIILVAPATDPAELAGYTMLALGEPDDPDVAQAVRVRPTIELARMYVDPAHHGSGVAGLLMAAALDAARRSGASSVWLGVSEENARANAFYARHGFERVGRKRFRIGDRWEDDFVRERVL